MFSSNFLTWLSYDWFHIWIIFAELFSRGLLRFYQQIMVAIFWNWLSALLTFSLLVLVRAGGWSCHGGRQEEKSRSGEGRRVKLLWRKARRTITSPGSLRRDSRDVNMILTSRSNLGLEGCWLVYLPALGNVEELMGEQNLAWIIFLVADHNLTIIFSTVWSSHPL